MTEGGKILRAGNNPAQLADKPKARLRLRFSLLLQLIGFVVTATLVTGIVVDYVVTSTSRNTIRQDVLDNNAAHAKMAAQFASNYMKAVQAHIQAFATRPDVLQAVLGNTPEELQPALAQFVQIQTALSGADVYDTKGVLRVYNTTGASTIGQSFADRDYYQQLITTLQPSLGAPTISKTTGQATMVYAVPIFDVDGQFRAFLTGVISLEGLSKAITGIDYGKDTEVSLIDTRNGGSVIASIHNELLLTQPSSENPAVKQLLEGKSGVVEVNSIAGEVDLVGFTNVPDLPLGVLFTTPEKVAMAVVNTLTQQTELYTSIPVLCAALVGTLWMVNITGPIRKLRDTSRQVATGDFSQRVNFKQHDEIGDLGRTFDYMAQELQEKDASLRTYATDLEKRLSERTAQLKESQNKLQALFDHEDTILAAVPDIIMEVDNDKIYTWANKAGLDFFGDDVVGKEAAYYFEGEQETYRAVNPVFGGTAGTVYVESWQRRKDGEKRLLAWYCRSLRDADGNVIGALSAATDITERKWMDEALRESEELYRSLFENMLNGFAYCQMLFEDGKPEDFIYLAVNDSFEQHTGLKDVVGKRVSEVIPGIQEADPELFERYGRVALTGKPEQFEVFVESMKMWFSISVYSPAPEYFVAVFDVITERKKAEEIMGRLSAIVTSAEDAIISKNMNGVIQTWNVGAEKIFGYSAEEAIGKYVSFLVPPGHADEVPTILKRLSQGEHIENFETVRMRKDGTIIPVSLNFSAIKDASGKVIGVSNIAHDITERKQAEEKIRSMNAELEARVIERTAALQAVNKELEAFSYSVSHDLRAPLRGTDGWSEALLEEAEAKLNQNEKNYLGKVRSETQRLGELIEALLQLARISKTDFNKQPVNISEVAEKLSGELKEKNPERNVEILIQPGLSVSGDANLLEAALANLIGNAWKFSGPREKARIEFGSMERDKKLIYYVRDNGVGFDMRYADKLFGAFQRLHKMSEFPGHGVGLATVQRIVHRHGGEIWAEAKVDQGATFYFTL